MKLLGDRFKKSTEYSGLKADGQKDERTRVAHGAGEEESPPVASNVARDLPGVRHRRGIHPIR